MHICSQSYDWLTKTSARMRVPIHLRVHIHTHIQTHIHTYIETHIRRPHACVCLNIYACTYIHTCIHTCIHTYTHTTSSRTRAPIHVSIYARTYIHTNKQTNTHTQGNGWNSDLSIGSYARVAPQSCDNDKSLCEVKSCGIQAGDLSSLTIPAGLKVTLFDQPEFKGNKMELKGPMNANDIVSV